MRPLVSVIIPTFNRSGDLARALQSVFAQTYANFEVLVVDNESTDNTDTLLAGIHDDRMRVFKISNRGIIAASRNLGLAESAGSYVALLDSDDWWMPSKLERCVLCLEQGRDVVYHKLFRVVRNSQKLFLRTDASRELRRPVAVDLLVKGNAIGTSSVVLRREKLVASGGFSEEKELAGIEDFDAWIRIARMTERFHFLPETLGNLWIGGGNVSNPKRTLMNLDALERRHGSVASHLRSPKGFDWTNYARGRAYYRIGAYEDARKYLRAASGPRAPIWIICKSYWMRFATGLRAKNGAAMNYCS